MKYLSYPLLVFFALLLSGCQAIGAIFKTGVWTGVILVIIVFGGIIAFLTRRGNKQ